MKKKNLAIYALVGAMAISPIFTSCVDSEETSSVTAIRNAKAEQLKAIADLNNAKAASTAAMAAADAALINAKAEAQKAKKEYDEAMTEWYNTQDEAAKADLEVTIKQAEKDLARIQGEIDEQAITIQATLLQAEYDLLVAQKALETATKDYDAYLKGKLQTLAQEYKKAVSYLIGYQKILSAEKSKLVKLETGLMEAEEALEATIAANNNQIALNNIQIETLKQYTDYTEDTDALYLEMIEASHKAELLEKKRNIAEKVWTDAQWGYYDKEEYKAYNEAWSEIRADEFYKFVRWGQFEVEEDEWVYSILNVTNYFKFTQKSERYEHKYVAESGEEFTYPHLGSSTVSYGYEMIGDMRGLELEALDATTLRNNRIKDLKEEITADKAEYAKAVKATTDAKKAWDEATTDKETKKDLYEQALATELTWKSEIEGHEAEVEQLTEEVANITKTMEMAKNAETLNAAMQEKVKAYNEAYAKLYAEPYALWDEYMALKIAAEEAETEYQALLDIYYYTDGASDIANRINELEASNKNLLKEIADAEKLLTQYEGYIMPIEVAIEFQKERVAVQEAIVKAQEVKVEEAKKALDAAMPAEEEEGTEAPEEGTEETPAE